jgi:hypothetical protein
LWGELGAQQRRQVAIDLNGIEGAMSGLEQQSRECSAAGSNLYQVIARRRAERGHDVREHRGIVEEVLAEALAPRRVRPRISGPSTRYGGSAGLLLPGRYYGTL